MAELLENEALARRIGEVLTADGPRKLAVAFWGPEIARKVKLSNDDELEIILDVSIGGTSKKALKALGVPKAKNVFVRDGLHSKIYICQYGAVVTSANASESALGRDFSGGRLIETGLWCDASADRSLYRAALAQFDSIKAGAHIATSADYDRAADTANPPVTWYGLRRSQGSLLEELASGADRNFYGNVVVVCANFQVSETQEVAARNAFSETLKSIDADLPKGQRFDPKYELVMYDEGNQGSKISGGSVVALYWLGEYPELQTFTDVIRFPVGKKDMAYYGIKDFKRFKKQINFSGNASKATIFKTDLAFAKMLGNIKRSGEKGRKWEEFDVNSLAEALFDLRG